MLTVRDFKILLSIQKNFSAANQHIMTYQNDPLVLHKIDNEPNKGSSKAFWWMVFTPVKRAKNDLSTFKNLFISATPEVFNSQVNNPEYKGETVLIRIITSPIFWNLSTSLPDIYKKIVASLKKKNCPLNDLVENGPLKGSSIFIQLCKTKAGQELLLANPDIFIRAAIDHLFLPSDVGETAFNSLCTSHIGIQILRALMSSIPVEKIVAALNFVSTYGTTPLFWLCSHHAGRTFLIDYPKLIEGIDIDTLVKTMDNCLLKPDKNKKDVQDHMGDSGFSMLCSSPEGCKILSILLAAKPESVEKIGIALNIPKEDGESPLLNLCQHKAGLQFLLNNPKLIDYIDINLLCKVRKDNTSILYWLCKSIEGRQILSQLLKKKPELLDKIDEALNAQKETGESALYYIYSTPDGRQLILAHPRLIEKSSLDALTSFFPENTGPMLLDLPGTHEGCLIFSQLLILNPSFQDETISFLNEIDDKDDEPMLLWTSKSRTHWLLFIASQPKMIAGINIDSLCYVYPNGESSLMNLCMSPEGCELLTKIILAQPTSEDKIAAALKHKIGDTNKTAIHLLRETEYGVKFLEQFPELNMIDIEGLDNFNFADMTLAEIVKTSDRVNPEILPMYFSTQSKKYFSESISSGSAPKKETIRNIFTFASLSAR